MKKFLKVILDILLYIWQLPQHILALIWMLVCRIKFGKPEKEIYRGRLYLHYPKWNCGVSLGNYILLGPYYRNDQMTKDHEWGHTRQSLIFGPLYLLIVGLISGIGNRYDVMFHTKERGWTYAQSYKWYYNQPIEKWADNLGGVVRTYDV